MARGWESKAVEEQQYSALAARESTLPIDDSGRARRAEREALLLTRSRTLADLQLACRPAHRAMLEHALTDLDRRLATLG